MNEQINGQQHSIGCHNIKNFNARTILTYIRDGEFINAAAEVCNVVSRISGVPLIGDWSYATQEDSAGSTIAIGITGWIDESGLY